MSPTVEQIHQAIQRTREARDRVQQRTISAIIDALAQTAKHWLHPNSSWRERAVAQAPQSTGFSEAMVGEAVDLTFGVITEEALGKLLEGCVAPWERRPRHDRQSEADSPQPTTAPQLIAHFLAGNVPPPGIESICSGLLLKSANLVKVSSRDPVFPALFVESLREVDAALADCVAVLDWRREERSLTQAALAEADAVIAYGDDETIAAIRKLCRPEVHFLGYGHKLSFAVIAKEALTKKKLASLAGAAAFDASVYDQQGCLSPHAFYVEEGGQISAREFAAALAEAMATYQARVPRGQLSVEEAAQIAKLRGAYEFRSATDKRVAVWASADATQTEPSLRDAPPQAGTPVPPQVSGITSSDWLVIYEEDPMFTPSCLNRVVFVKPVERLELVPELMRRFASHLSTVGIAPLDERAVAFADELAKLGVSRVCPVGQMQRPSLHWHHDDRPNLADLLGWTDVR